MEGFIYKITCLKNNKVYIGLTTTSIKKRWRQHLLAAKTSDKHLYRSMRKHGVENFIIEEIDRTDDYSVLGELERKYIKEYNSTDENFGYNNTHGGESNQLDGNPRARITTSDVEEIRRLYDAKENGVKSAWERYKERISYSAFEKIWEGITWKGILSEVYTKENKVWHRVHNDGARKGGNNVNAIYTDEEVNEMRRYYVDHTLQECFEKFGKKSKSVVGFRNIIDRGYTHLPVFKKQLKKWIYPNDEENDTKRVCRKNDFLVENGLLYITVYGDYNGVSRTFYTNEKFLDSVSDKNWRYCGNSLNALVNGKSITLKNLIKNGKQGEKYFNIDGNIFNCTEENLTKDRCDVLLKDVNKKEFINDYRVLSMRGMSRKYGVSRDVIIQYYRKIIE